MPSREQHKAWKRLKKENKEKDRIIKQILSFEKKVLYNKNIQYLKEILNKYRKAIRQ